MPGRKEPKALFREAVWTKSLKDCADPQRAKHFLEVLGATDAASTLREFGPEQARILAALFGGSQALSDSLVAHPEWLTFLTAEALKFPRQKKGLQNEASERLDPLLKDSDFHGALIEIRRLKHREMFRIAARGLRRLGHQLEHM